MTIENFACGEAILVVWAWDATLKDSKSLKIKPFLTQQLKELHARILKGFNLQELLRQL